MPPLTKNQVLIAALVGGFGGLAPSLIKLIPGLFDNQLPSSGTMIALAVLAVIGVVTVAIFGEKDLRKALVLGAGAPAMIASLTTAAISPTSTGEASIGMLQTAYAQPQARQQRVKLVI